MTRFRFVSARAITLAALLLVIFTALAQAQSGQSDKLPLLADEPVNDFAHVLDPSQEGEIKRMAATLKAATGDIVYVVTVETFAPHGSIQELAVKLFENQGRGIGEKGKDNGLLVVLALKDRQVWIEVGYGLEGFITDGFSGETSRQYMVPYFRKNEYGEGLRVGVQRVIARIAQGRNVSLENVHAPSAPQSEQRSRGGRIPFGLYVFIAIILINVLTNGFGGGRRRRGRWGGGGWSGWSGGVGGFGGGGGSWGGGFGGGGGGGGFGGFGGGRSGGGGGGASW